MRSKSSIPYVFAAAGAVIITMMAIFIQPLLLVRFTIFFLFSFFILTLSLILSIIGPNRFRYRLRDWSDESKYFRPEYDRDKFNVVLDTHCHTRKSPDGALKLRQLVAYHKAVGFNACVVTDHNIIGHIEEMKRLNEENAGEFLIIPGMEYTTSRIHMCFLGIEEWEIDSIPSEPTDDEIRDAIRKVHDMGGVAVVCHYPWSTWGYYPRTHDHPSREQVYDWGADYIEVSCWDDDRLPIDYASYTFVTSPTRPNIAPCVGTDVHEPYRAQICGWTLLRAKELTIDAVMEELRALRTDVHLLSECVSYPIRHRRNTLHVFLTPFMALGKAIQRAHLGGHTNNIETGSIASWIGWIEALFILFEAVRFVIK